MRKLEFLTGKSLAHGRSLVSGMEGWENLGPSGSQDLVVFTLCQADLLTGLMVRTGSGFCSRPTVLPRDTRLSRFLVPGSQHPLGTGSSAWAVLNL